MKPILAALREWAVRLTATLRPRRSDRDMEEELRLHMELAAESARHGSDAPDDAARAAGLRLGGVAQAMESLRDQRGLPWLTDLARDVKYGCRLLAKDPGFTVVAVLSLAIGIGANSAVFSFADALLLRPVAVPRPGEIVTVGSTAPLGTSLFSSYRDYVDIRDRSRSFDGLAACAESSVAFARGPQSTPTSRIGMLVSENFFQVAGVEPEVGRTFRPDEHQVPGRDSVVILSHDVWEREFDADPAILGRSVRLNGNAFTVVGVMPASFIGLLNRFTRYEFYVPLMMWSRLMPDQDVQGFDARDFRSLTVKGRLTAGVTLAGAQTELAVIATDLEHAYPSTNRNTSLVVRTELQDRLAESEFTNTLVAMLALLSAAVLAVACANVSGLLASRASTRARELALRMAIGGGRGRLVRQLLTESVLIAVAGGVLGLGVGAAGVALFSQFRIATDLPIAVPFELDQRALVASLLISVASAAFFGFVPALQATRADLTSVMKAGDTAGSGRRRRGGRALLVAGQVAVSVVVLAVAAFVYRDVQERFAAGPGFPTDHRLMMWIDANRVRYTDQQARQFFDQLAERTRLLPGVTSATLTSFVPMDGGARRVKILPEGFEFPSGTEAATLYSASIDEHYATTMQLSMVSGRSFRAADSANAPAVAIVNQLAAERYWPGQTPLGKRFRLKDGHGPWVEVVGVARTNPYFFLIEAPIEFVYFPFQQRPQSEMAFVVESSGDPALLASPVREVVRALNADLPISNLRTLDETYRMRVVSILGIVVQLIGAMGVMGLVLAVIGLYGLVAYSVSRRTKEIGVRMAVGAGQLDVLRLVTRQGVALAAAGLGLGGVVSAGVSRALPAVFPGRAEVDAPTHVMAFLAVAAVVVVVTLLAAIVPARRATRVNPTEALRCE